MISRVPLPLHHAMCAQNKVVCLDFLGALARGRLGLGVLDDTVPAGDLGKNLTHDLVLDEEDVGYVAIEPVSPNMSAGLSVDELRG